MCGFVAVLSKHPDGPVDGRVLAEVTDVLSHRGPDDRGLWIDGEVGLGHRRLSVIDLGGGHQPMAGPEGRAWIAYNGEIYNYKELRTELASRGVRLRTASDTEVIVSLYELHGPSFVERLDGMFAFAIWDRANHSLLLGRDRAGVKPLYVWEGRDWVVAASEVKAVLAFPGVPRRVRQNCIAEMLAFRTLSGGRTPFEGIEALQPGTLRTYRREGERTLRYWEIPECASAERLDADAAESALTRLLADSVRGQLVADVPVGTFNSGGLDSSVVTALASRFVSEPVRSFAVTFEEREYDEGGYARSLARFLGTVHEELAADSRLFADNLPAAIWHLDHPLHHPNSILLRMLSKITKEKVTVVLTGEGADELFAGYPRYGLPRLLSLARPWSRAGERALRAILSRGRGRRLRLIASALCKPTEYAIAQNACTVLEDEVLAVCDGDWLGERLAYVPARGEVLDRMLRFEIDTYLQSVLERMDKMTMSWGLEARVPFLDHRIMELATRIPPAARRSGLRGKIVLRRVAMPLVPAEIVHRPKSGFGVPLDVWFRDQESLGRYLGILTEPRTLERGWWRRNGIEEVVRQQRSGVNRGELLWSLINVELWARIMVDRTLQPEGVFRPRAPQIDPDRVVTDGGA